MATTGLDVLGIGNAIVDVLSHSTDQFLATHDLPKGIMTLIDAEQAEALYRQTGPGTEISGGSAANTIAGIAAMGGRAGFIGKVSDDQLGQVFSHDIRALGVAFETALANGGPSTARCLILVTPDAQRTMTAYLGAAQEISAADVDPKLVGAAAVTYLEGYLWDPPGGKAAFRRAIEICRDRRRKVALSLSDPFCVDRHRADFLELIEHDVDILFANEDEVVSLYQAADFDTALQRVRGHCEIVALTRSAKGSVIVRGDEAHVIDAEPIDRLVDTTGAGDQYAAGFLYALTQGRELHDCGRAGAIAAAEVIAHFGARPEADIGALLAGQLG